MNKLSLLAVALVFVASSTELFAKHSRRTRARRQHVTYCNPVAYAPTQLLAAPMMVAQPIVSMGFEQIAQPICMATQVVRPVMQVIRPAFFGASVNLFPGFGFSFGI